MENNISTNGVPDERDAARMFVELEGDRERLAEKARAPRWLAPAFGLIAAAYVSIPAFPWEEMRNSILIAAMLGGMLLVAGYHRATGVKIARLGAREWAVFGVALLLTLVFLSVAFGLAAAGLSWWIVAAAIVAFAAVTWFATLIHSSLRERLRHDS